MDTSLDNNPFAISNGASTDNNMPQKGDGLLLNLSDNFKQNGKDISPTADFFANLEKANGKRPLSTEFDDEDLGPETDVDTVDDVLMSPALAAARSLAEGISNNNPESCGFNPFAEESRDNIDLDLDLSEQKLQGSEAEESRMAREETPTPPADAVHDVSGLVDNVAESGEDSEDEWNYIKGDAAKENIDPSQPDLEVAELTENDAMSQLNPNAAEFVPVSPTRSIPSPACRALINDQVISQSPKRPTQNDIDLSVPNLQDFESEVKSRPHEVELCKNGDGQDADDHDISTRSAMEEFLNNGINYDEMKMASTPVKTQPSEEFHFGPNAAPFTPAKLMDQSEAAISTKAVFGDESVATLDTFNESGEDNIDFSTLKKDEDPMSTSFYQDKDDDSNPFDPNKVHMLPENLDDFLNKPGDNLSTFNDTISDLPEHNPSGDIILDNDEKIQTTDLDKAVDDEKELASPVSQGLEDDNDFCVIEKKEHQEFAAPDFLGGKSPAACSPEPTLISPEPSALATELLQPTAASPVPAALSPQPALSPEPADLQGMLAPEPTQCLQDHVSVSPQPNVLSPEPLALSPQPSALSPEPCAVSPLPSALSPEPCEVSSEPSALSPEPCAVSPQPSALSPEPPHSPQPSVSPCPDTFSPRSNVMSPEPSAPPLEAENFTVESCVLPKEQALTSPHIPSSPELILSPVQPALSPEPVVLSPEPFVLSTQPLISSQAQSPEPTALSPEPVMLSPKPTALSPEPTVLSSQASEFSLETIETVPVAKSPEPAPSQTSMLSADPFALNHEKPLTPESAISSTISDSALGACISPMRSPSPGLNKEIEEAQKCENALFNADLLDLEKNKLEEGLKKEHSDSPFEDITSSVKDDVSSPVKDLSSPISEEAKIIEESFVASMEPVVQTEPMKQDAKEFLSDVCSTTNKSFTDTESVTTTDVNSFLERTQLPDVTSPLSPDQTCLLNGSYTAGSVDIKTEHINREFAEPAVLTPSEESRQEDLTSVVPEVEEKGVTEPSKDSLAAEAVVAAAAAAVAGTAVVAAVADKKTPKVKSAATSAKKPAKTASSPTKPPTKPSTTKTATSRTATTTAAKTTATTAATKTTKLSLSSPKPPTAKATPKPKTATTAAAANKIDKKPLTNGDIKTSTVRSNLTAKKTTDTTTSARTTTTSRSLTAKPGPAAKTGSARPATAPTRSTTASARTTATAPKTAPSPRPAATTSTMPKPRPTTLSRTAAAPRTTSSTTTKTTVTKSTLNATSPRTSTTTTARPRPSTAPAAKPRVPLTKTVTKGPDVEKQSKESANKLTASRTSASTVSKTSATGRTVASTVRKTETKGAGTGTRTITKTTTSTLKTTASGAKKPTEIIRKAKTTTTNTKSDIPKENGLTTTTVITEQITIVNNAINEINQPSPDLIKDNSPLDNKLLIDNTLIQTNTAD